VPAKINPRKLRGPWTDGYALDVHTTSSTMIGHNAYGHCGVGYGPLAAGRVALSPEEPWGSINNPRNRRGGGREGCLAKIKSTGQLKDVFDYAKRAEILKDVFSVDATQLLTTTAGARAV
jgi:hypothetical protein